MNCLKKEKKKKHANRLLKRNKTKKEIVKIKFTEKIKDKIHLGL